MDGHNVTMYVYLPRNNYLTILQLKGKFTKKSLWACFTENQPKKSRVLEKIYPPPPAKCDILLKSNAKKEKQQQFLLKFIGIFFLQLGHDHLWEGNGHRMIHEEGEQVWFGAKSNFTIKSLTIHNLSKFQFDNFYVFCTIYL